MGAWVRHWRAALPQHPHEGGAAPLDPIIWQGFAQCANPCQDWWVEGVGPTPRGVLGQSPMRGFLERVFPWSYAMVVPLTH